MLTRATTTLMLRVNLARRLALTLARRLALTLALARRLARALPSGLPWSFAPRARPAEGGSWRVEVEGENKACLPGGSRTGRWPVHAPR